MNLIETTLKYANTFPKSKGAYIQRKRLYLIEDSKNSLPDSSFDIYAIVKKIKTISFLFCVYIPCKHQILSKAHDIIIEMEEYIKKYKVDISIVDLLFQILNSDCIHYRAKLKLSDVTSN